MCWQFVHFWNKCVCVCQAFVSNKNLSSFQPNQALPVPVCRHSSWNRVNLGLLFNFSMNLFINWCLWFEWALYICKYDMWKYVWVLDYGHISTYMYSWICAHTHTKATQMPSLITAPQVTAHLDVTPDKHSTALSIVPLLDCYVTGEECVYIIIADCVLKGGSKCVFVCFSVSSSISLSLPPLLCTYTCVCACVRVCTRAHVCVRACICACEYIRFWSRKCGKYIATHVTQHCESRSTKDRTTHSHARCFLHMQKM